MTAERATAGPDRGVVLLISSRTSPYWQDIPEILARENGAAFHFRYRSALVPSRLFNHCKQLEEREACIVHLDGPEEDLEYLPVRAAKIVSADNLGEHIRIEFVLKDPVSHPARTQDGKNRYAGSVRDAIRASGCREGYRGDFVVDSGIRQFELAGDQENWTRVIRELARFPTFCSGKPTIFLQGKWLQARPPMLQGLTGTTKDDHGPASVKYDEEGRPIFRGGRDYSLHLIQYVPSEDANGKKIDIDAERFPVPLELQADGSVITPSLKATEVRGKYDDAYLSVRCQPVTRASVGFVQLGAKTDYFNVPRLRFREALVRRTWGILALTLLAATLFLLGAGAPVILAGLSSFGVKLDPSVAPIVTGSFQALAGIVLVFVAARAK